MKILADGYQNKQGSEGSFVCTLGKLWLMQAGGRHKIEVDKAGPGMWIGIEGVDQFLAKTGTIVAVDDAEADALTPI